MQPPFPPNPNPNPRGAPQQAPWTGPPYTYGAPTGPAPWSAPSQVAVPARPRSQPPVWPFILIAVVLVAGGVGGFMFWRSRGTDASSKRASTGASAKAAPTVEFGSALQNWVTCKTPECSVKITPGAVTVRAPKGTKVGVDGVSVEATGKEESIPIDVFAFIRERELPQHGTTHVQWPAKVRVTFPGGATGETTVKIDANEFVGALKERLAPATKGAGVTFPDEGPAPAKPRVIALLDEGMRLFGRGVGATSIDLVASYQKKTRTLSCGAYQGSDGHVEVLENTGTDFDVTVFDRRTGKKVDTKLIKGEIAPCQASQAGHYTGYEPFGALWEAMAAMVK